MRQESRNSSERNSSVSDKPIQPAMLQYSGRPHVEAEVVSPTLCGWAHEVVPGEAGGRGSIYLGPLQSCDGSEPGTLEQLRAAGVGAIVNCTMYAANAFEGQGIEYRRIAVRDEADAGLLVFMLGAANFIEARVARGCSVLVHCENCVSRSASIVMAHQIRFGAPERSTREAVYVAVKSVRQVVDPNPGFWEQLADFEKVCAGPHNATFT